MTDADIIHENGPIAAYRKRDGISIVCHTTTRLYSVEVGFHKGDANSADLRHKAARIVDRLALYPANVRAAYGIL